MPSERAFWCLQNRYSFTETFCAYDELCQDAL